MKFASALDELGHYVGQLTVDLALGVDRRHLLSTARLCEVLIERIDAANPAGTATLNETEFEGLAAKLLGLQQSIKGAPPAAPGRLRVIRGGMENGNGTRQV